MSSPLQDYQIQQLGAQATGLYGQQCQKCAQPALYRFEQLVTELSLTDLLAKSGCIELELERRRKVLVDAIVAKERIANEAQRELDRFEAEIEKAVQP